MSPRWPRVAVWAAVVVVLGVAVLALAGCGPSVAAGQVVAKEHSPSYVYVTYIVCGKSMCPMTQVMPESWELKVCEGEAFDTDRVCEWWRVSQTRYEATNVGDQVTKEGDNG